MNPSTKYSLLAIAVAGTILATPAQASDQSAWVPEQGSGEIVLGYGQQTADRFYAGDAEMALPVDLELDTTFLGFSYGLTDRLAVDAQLAYAKSDFAVDPVLSPEGGLSGLADSKIGLRYSLYNADGAAVAIRAAAIIEGNYDTGALSAIGDGGSGAEVALLAGKAFDSGFGINGEVAYRTRSSGIPDDWSASATLSYAFNDYFGAYAGYQILRADGDLDIGGAGFSPARFPEVDEDYEIAQGGLSFQFSETWGGGIGYGRKLDGRNTAKSDFWNVALAYSF